MITNVAQPTDMRREINEIPQAITRLLEHSYVNVERAASACAEINPRFLTTIARGSSDHASSYLKYVLELSTGLPVASIGPSVASIYDTTLNLTDSVSLAISQSGKSPDIVQMLKSARNGGALPIAITNNAASPLSDIAHHTIDICAGSEKSVAATKTFVNSIVAGLLLLALWKRDDGLIKALHNLPEQAQAAIDCDWSEFSDRMLTEQSLFVLGRGPSMSIAHEVALKFKETCQIHAEAYSSAEVLHGPVSIVGQKYPVLALAARDASQASVIETVKRMSDSGADIYTTSDAVKDGRLPFAASGHPLTDPLLLVVSFYSFIENLALKRGLNPDLPPNLRKVTETV